MLFTYTMSERADVVSLCSEIECSVESVECFCNATSFITKRFVFEGIDIQKGHENAKRKVK